MPISYSKDICLSLDIFSISRLYPSLLVPKSDKFNTKPLPSYSKGDRFYFYLIDIYNKFCSCALCMLACVFLYLRVQCMYLVCQILWLHYLEKYLQSILLIRCMCVYFQVPVVCRILWQVRSGDFFIFLLRYLEDFYIYNQSCSFDVCVCISKSLWVPGVPDFMAGWDQVTAWNVFSVTLQSLHHLKN